MGFYSNVTIVAGKTVADELKKAISDFKEGCWLNKKNCKITDFSQENYPNHTIFEYKDIKWFYPYSEQKVISGILNKYDEIADDSSKELSDEFMCDNEYKMIVLNEDNSVNERCNAFAKDVLDYDFYTVTKAVLPIKNNNIS